MAIRPGQSYKKIFEMSINPASVSANVVAAETFTSTEKLSTEDTILINFPAFAGGLGVSHYWVSAADTISIAFFNPTGVAINESAVTIKVIVL
jgi:hypothetical protein